MPKLSHTLSLAAALVLLGACAKTPDAPPPPPPPPPMNMVLPNVPVPPEGVALATESGADATQLTFNTPLKPDSIINHYRFVLGGGGKSGFRLVSEAKSMDKESTIFVAEQDGPAIWVTVKSDGAGGTAVTIAGGADLGKKKPT